MLETFRGCWKAFRTFGRHRRVAEQTRASQFQCELLEPRLLLSAVSGVDDKLAFSLVDSIHKELGSDPVIVVDADQSQDDQAQQQKLVEPFQIDLDNSFDAILQPALQSLDSDGLEEAITDEADQDLLPNVGLIGDNAEVTSPNTSTYGLDITLQSFQLSAVETYTYQENITSDSEELSSDLAISDGYDDTTEQLTETLLAANPPPVSAESAALEPATQTTLTNDWLIPIVQEAINRWSVTTLVADSQVSLDNVQFQIIDLPTGILAQVTGDVVSIDPTASGFGWFIDSTPADDIEFSGQASNHQLTASQESVAYGQIDLLTVVSHELGHLLGLEDVAPLTDADSLMTATLGPGIRRLPSHEEALGNPSLQGLEAISNAYVAVDLVATINSYLGSNESGSVVITEAKLGGFLDLFTLTLDFSSVVYSGGSYDSGLVNIISQVGELFPGQSAFVSITDGDSDGTAISGAYNPVTGQFSLTLDQFELSIPYVLTAGAENVTIQYDPAGASNQTLVTIGSFEMVLLVLDNTTVQVNNLNIRQDGFSIDNAAISVAAATWLNAIQLSNFALTFTDVNFSTTVPTLSGTIDVSATTIKLFPSQDFFTTEITTFSGGYNFGTSALDLSAANLKVAFSDVLLLELGTANFSMDANAGTFSASVTSGTLSSPRFTDLPSVSVTNLAINQAGLSFDTATLGPINFEIGSVLTIEDFSLVVTNFSYSTSDSSVAGTIGFAFTSVGIFPGQSLFTAQIDNFSGSYDIVSKALNIRADNVIIQISDLLKVTAADVDININPFSMSFGSIVVVSPKFPDITGTLTKLEITETGFSLGSAILSYGGDISIGPLTVNGLGIGITDYEYSSVALEPFSGSILFYSGGASLNVGGSFSTVISDTDADGMAISATLNFENGAFEDLQFMVDKLEINIGTFLTFTTTGVDIDTGAENDDFIIDFSSISASVTVGGLSVTGTGKNFGITASGKLMPIPGEQFGVVLEIGGAAGSDFQWPSWLPIRVNTLGLDFTDIENAPLDFTFILSASVSGLPAVAGLEFSGTIEGIRIRPALLLEGKFPVVDIESIGVSVVGQLFGGELNAALIGGILKIAEPSPGTYEVIGPTDTTTPVYDRVLFMGVQGGFSMPGVGGLTIRFALSELGPLGVFLNIEVPGGIVLEPHIGLAVNDFAAGVEFFKSLPSIDDPFQLRDPAFAVSSTVSADTWLASVKDQVFSQYVSMQDNPNLPGFLAAFTSPMLIKGSAKIYTIYTSQQVFNGQVDLILSTDGKFLISGKLNFAADNITISGKLYADLSNILNGDVTVLFLADIPEQVRLLSIDGKLKMGFRDESGQEVEIPVVISDPVDRDAETSGDLASPGNGELIDVGVINSNRSDGSYYIDVKFQPGANQTLDYSTILDTDDTEILVNLIKVDGTVVPINFDTYTLPIETNIIGGISEDTVLTAGTQAELISLLESRNVQRFRYVIASGFTWDSGVVEVTFVAGTWGQSDGSVNSEETETFTILGPIADISNPSNGGRIKISEFDGRMYLDVTFVPTRTPGAIVSGAPFDAPVLSGPGLGSISIIGVPTSVSVPVTFPDGSMTLRYELSGQFALGEVTLTFEAETFEDSEGFKNTIQNLTFVVDGATADLHGPANGETVGLTVLQNEGHVDVVFTPAWGGGIDVGTLNDGAPEIEVTLSDGTKLAITDDPTGSYDLDGKSVFRYSFTGTLVPGTATVIFLDDSFADTSGLTNIEEVETFFIDQPTVILSNLADGATYLTTSFNELDEGKQVGIYEDSATERYFELTLIPTSGANIDESTIQFDDLQIAGLPGISINRVERVIEQIGDDKGNPVDSPTNRFRFFFTGSFPDQAPVQVTFSMAAGAWRDTADNESGGMSGTITVRKPAAIFYIALEGGITLEAAGFLEEPIFDVRGYVNFEAKLTPDGPRFELDFGGTGEVVYLGNLGSMAGLFIMQIPEKFILETHDDPDKDPDALTAADLLTDLGVTLEQGHFLNLIQLPKLWGVVKLETNFEVLKEIGIDLKAEALLEINITAEVKVETITLEGIPGDSFAQLAASDTLIDELNSDSLPDELSALFTGDNELGGTYEVRTVIGGVLWRVIDSVNEKQYFIQVQDETPLPTQANPDPQPQLKLLLRNETQEFVLQSKVLQVQAYGQAIFRFPAYVNPEKTEMGPEWFRLTGAFSLKLSTSSLEVFQNGQLTLSPAGRKILDIRSMAVLIVKANPIGLAGKIKLGANIELPGVLLSGNLEAYVNTFGTDQVFEVSGFLQPIVGFDSVTIYGASPILNPNYDPADATSDILVADDDPNATGGAYLTIAARADLHILDDAIMLRGAFRISATTEIVEVRAAITTAITIPGLPDPLFDLNGLAAFALDADGFYGRADLELDAGFPSTQLTPGFDLEAEFLLELNTASIAKEIQTFEFSKTTGNKLDLVTVSLPALKLQLIAGGTLSFSTTTDSTAFELAGRFEFLITQTLLEVQAEASLTGGSLVNANAAGTFQLNSYGLAGFIQINVSAGAGDTIGDTGLTEIIGADFELFLELALYINTGGTDVIISGVNLTRNEVKLEASGFLQLSIDGVAGFLIEGSLLVQANNDGFAVEVHGVLSAKVLDVTLVRLGVDGGLVITADTSLGYVIAGKLDLTAGAGAVLDGNGFTFDAALTLEVNTTGGVVNLGTAGTLSAGIYARIHAEGMLSFLVGGNTGFTLGGTEPGQMGTFDIEVGSNGLLVAVNADFRAQVAGQTILKLRALGALLINDLGIAAKIELTLGVDPSIGGTGFSFYGTFIFELNTTTEQIDYIASTPVSLVSGPYVYLSIIGEGSNNAYLQLSLGSSSNSFRLEGSFTLQAGSNGLEVAANGMLKAIVGGTTLLSIDAEGALLINQNGIAAKISLSASGGFGGTSFQFAGSFLLEVNTTNRFINTIAGQQINLAAGLYARIDISGSLEILQLITINGDFELEVGSAGLDVNIDAKLYVFSVGFDVDADLVIDSSGMVLRTELSLTTAPSFIPFNNFKISGALILEVNTTSSPAYVGSVFIPKQTARINVLNGELNILGLKATGSITISAGIGGFEFIVPDTDPLTLKVGPITAELFGYIKNSGFSFTATSYFETTAGSAYLNATATITLSNSEFYFHVSGNAGLKIGKINIKVSASGDVYISGTRLLLSVTGSVDLGLLGSISATVTFKLGTISPPGAAQVTPEPVLATPLSNGILRLNIGSFASVRGAGFSGIEDEVFYVTHDSGTSSSETVIVSAFGFSQTYSNVKSILVSDAGSGNDFVQISENILVNAVINGGDSDDTLIYLGSGTAIINGGAGDDFIQVSAGNSHILNGGTGNDRLAGGSAGDTLNGGRGNDTLDGGGNNDKLNGSTGFDNILGGGGNDLILWQTGDGADPLIDGGSGNSDLLQVTLTNADATVQFDPAASGDGFELTLSGTVLVVVNIEKSDLNTAGGTDSVTVNHLGTSTLGDISIRLGSDSVTDSITVNGSAITDVFTMSVSGERVNIEVEGVVSISVEQAGGTNGGADFALNTDSGDDTLTIQQTLAGTVTTVNTGPGNDTINVSSNGNVNGIAGQLIINGQSASDTLNVDDSGDSGANTGTLTANLLSGLGTTQGIQYNNIEYLNIKLGTGPNTLNIQSINVVTTTTVFTGTGTAANIINIGSTAPDTNGNVDNIDGLLVIEGQSSSDTVNVDNTGDITPNEAHLTSNSLTGLGMEIGINYSGIEMLNISLGPGDDQFTILSTHNHTTMVNSNNGDDKVAVRTISGPTTINAGNGCDTINVGSQATSDTNTGGNVNGIGALLSVNGQANSSDGADTLNVDDTGDVDDNSGNLTNTAITGLGMTDGITYGTLEVIEINLGSGNDTFNVESTYRSEGFQTWTIVNTGQGDEVVTVSLYTEVDGAFALNTQAGDDIVHASDSTLPLVIFGGQGNDTIGSGQAEDIIFGDRGRVDYSDEIGKIVTRLGIEMAAITGNLTSTTAMTLVDSTASFPTGDNGLRGLVVQVIFELDGQVQSYKRLITDNDDTSLTLAEAWDVTPPDGNEYRIMIVPEYQTDGVVREPQLILPLDKDIGGSDTIFGNAGEDIIMGGSGDDVIIGGAGNDTIDGNAGDDLILGDNIQFSEQETATGATASVRYRVLLGETIYGETGNYDGLALVDMDSWYSRPGSVPQWADWIINLGDDANGDDYIAGGAGNDTIFGQSGNDTIQGDGSIAGALADNPVWAYRDPDGYLTIAPSFESPTDGDDYIEGNAGNDVIFGNLGQDDIIGGSSDLFGLTTRQDGSDIIFGGGGTDITHNDPGDTAETGHARDADMILGDNGNIFRLVGTNKTGHGAYLTFNYDIYSTALNIIPRAAVLIDYTPGTEQTGNDKGAADELHGESGDDFIYGMVGNDIIFGEGQDDDLIGGWGHDWISGGTGDDGVLGDDGRIYTSRNGTPESLYAIEANVEQNIYTQGKAQQATINLEGQLKKSVNLTPLNVDPEQDPLYEARNANDIIYGGLGNDWLHGGSGDDAISGAEALEGFYDNPDNPGDYLGYDPETGTFTYYDFDQDDLLYKIEGFYLNFEAEAGDGNDVLFGDLGNDWLVGGTDNDHLYGGYGSDVLNLDDNLETNKPDPENNDGIDDVAYGGAGRDILIANTEADRLIDWTGEFNSYLVPFPAFGKSTISRRPAPSLMKYLYDLSKSDGADQTLGLDTDPGRARNGEPFGELGLVMQKDIDWYNQTGSPRGPQAGNAPGKKK